MRHRPERTLLYQLVAEYYPAFKAHLAAQGTTLPGNVEQEFEAYLQCGRLEHGVPALAMRPLPYQASGGLRMQGTQFLPELRRLAHGGERGTAGARVFPARTVRQWVLSVPYPLRFLFASRPEVKARVLGLFYRGIATHLIQKAADTPGRYVMPVRDAS